MPTPEDEKPLTVEALVADLEDRMSQLRLMPLSEETLRKTMDLNSDVMLVRRNRRPFSPEVAEALDLLSEVLAVQINEIRSARELYEKKATTKNAWFWLTNLLPSKLATDLAKVRDGFLVDTAALLSFLLVLWLGDILVARLWGLQAFFEGSAHPIPFKWFFEGGDIALVICFILRSCARLLGIMKDEGDE
jgi:hypothetical protein